MIFGNSHWHCSIVVKPQRMAVVIGRRRAVAVQSCEPAAHFLRFVEGFLDDAIEWQTLPRESTGAIGDWRLAIERQPVLIYCRCHRSKAAGFAELFSILPRVPLEPIEVGPAPAQYFNLQEFGGP